jgi:transcriptional regulator with XRE-family HTH domain
MKKYNENKTYNTFGEFISAKRRAKALTSSFVAESLGISPGYFCDIEKSRKNPPDRAMQAKLLQILQLVGDDINTFHDLAGKARSEAPTDLPEYINTNQVVRVALRLAKNKGNEDDWRRFILYLENRQMGEVKC